MEAGAPEVAILDRVTLRRAEAEAWLERMHRDYRPGAEARGLSLAGVWQTRADEHDAVEVVIVWTVPDARAFFATRAGSNAHDVVAWWKETDALALSRERTVMQAIDAP